jgi:hypothetical protein
MRLPTLPVPQANHQTETLAEHRQATTTASNLKHVSYDANLSYLPDGFVSLGFPVTVINKGTALYEQLRMDDLVNSIQIMPLVAKFLSPIMKDPVCSPRGNIHRFFGLAGSQNVGGAGTSKLILKHYGVTMPRVLKDSTDPDIRLALQVGWKIGREAKIHSFLSGQLFGGQPTVPRLL